MSRMQGIETLSRRATENVREPDFWEPLITAVQDPWSRTNPNGMAILGVAENTLMHNELEHHIKSNFKINRWDHFSYGIGPQGSLRLRKALSGFFNDRFEPRNKTEPCEFLPTTGVTALIDHLTWGVCDDGEGILYPQPLYAGFTNDVPLRARGKLVPVPFTRDDASLDLDDVFDVQANLRCFERAYRQSLERDIKIKGVMITNPHNPLGKCYTVETIKAIASFCAKYDLHYMSDEIYAMSVFTNPAYPNATPFTSVLAIDLDNIINRNRVHVLYGMSKDFCANGLRLGALHSRNAALRSALTGLVAFGWETYLVQDMWARILEDQKFLDNFISTNQKRLAEHYCKLTDFLRKHEIPYYEGGNAGFFLWVDLRKWLLGASHAQDVKSLLVSSPAADKYRAKEETFSQKWLSKGVMISRGTSFVTEELGWFRIVFTVDEACLRLGLQRFVDGINELQGSSQL